MESRKHTWQESIAYLYVAFADLSDGDLSDVELDAIKEETKEWGGESQTNEEFRSAMLETLKWYRSNRDNEVRSNVLTSIAETLVHQQWFGVEKRTKVVGDLINIASVDGKLHEGEKQWIQTIATSWGIDVEF